MTQSAVEALLKTAVSKIGGGELGEAAEYTFGLAAGTRAWPAQQRRKKAAERVGVTTDHFRKTYEKLIFEQVAEGILACVPATSPVQVRESTVAPATTADPIVMRTFAGPESLVERLAEAVSVTIVEPTHEDLAELLERALLRKRERFGEPAFWDDLRVVFLSDDLLGLVRDDLTARFPDPAQAERERRRRAGLGRRTVMSLLLRRGVPGRWSLHSYAGLMPLRGAVLLMKDGRAIVQLTASPSHRAGPDGLRFEFDDRPDHYFASIFDEIVDNSREEHEVVLVGSPTGTAAEFLCHGARFRRGVMIPRQNIDDWLPAVIVISWRRRGGRYEAGRELYIDGLAGLQYRGFFTDILPVYADVGVRSAGDVLAAIHADPAMRQAVRDLESCYEDERLITALPIEV